MVLTSSTVLLLLSLNTAILLCFFLENIWLPCWASLLPEHVLFVHVHPQRVPTTYNCREHVPACYNCRELVLATYNCREHFPLVITVRNTFPLVITIENTFLLVITVGNSFPLLITVGNTFPLVITVKKNSGSSFFLNKRATSEMSSMGHRSSMKAVLKNFAVFTGKKLLESLFNKVAALQVCKFIEKRPPHRCFPVHIANFCLF